MATGYTHKVQKGEASFRDFVLDCARGINYLAIMRDEPHDAEIPDEFLPHSYHKEVLENSKKRLQKVENMSLEEAEKEAKKEYKLGMVEFRRNKEENKQVRKNYESMLEQVKNWQPPTEKHIGLRDFMKSQLEESVEFDCSYKPTEPQKQSGAEYKTRLIESAKRDFNYHTDEWNKEVQRSKERTEWVQALKKSLPSE